MDRSKDEKEMNLLKAATTISCLALIAAVTAPMSKADDWNNKTVMTFSGPVEIPGVHQKGWGVLPAGTYVFKLLDSQSDRHIVQIFSEDQKTVIATILAIPNYRLKATDKTVITFSERPAGEPEALRAWFYPGKNWGDEFVYPKARAIEIAKITNTPVLFAVPDLPVEVVEPIKSASAPVVLALKRAPIMAIQPTGEQVQLALVVTAPPPAELELTAAPVVAATLPATASNLPLIGLFGLMALGGAFLLRANRKERSAQRL
jgi:LPXTG-motif cell wall-anchored protein